MIIVRYTNDKNMINQFVLFSFWTAWGADDAEVLLSRGGERRDRESVSITPSWCDRPIYTMLAWKSVDFGGDSGLCYWYSILYSPFFFFSVRYQYVLNVFSSLSLEMKGSSFNYKKEEEGFIIQFSRNSDSPYELLNGRTCFIINNELFI